MLCLFLYFFDSLKSNRDQSMVEKLLCLRVLICQARQISGHSGTYCPAKILPTLFKQLRAGCKPQAAIPPVTKTVRSINTLVCIRAACHTSARCLAARPEKMDATKHPHYDQESAPPLAPHHLSVSRHQVVHRARTG